MKKISISILFCMFQISTFCQLKLPLDYDCIFITNSLSDEKINLQQVLDNNLIIDQFLGTNDSKFFVRSYFDEEDNVTFKVFGKKNEIGFAISDSGDYLNFNISISKSYLVEIQDYCKLSIGTTVQFLKKNFRDRFDFMESLGKDFNSIDLPLKNGSYLLIQWGHNQKVKYIGIKDL